MAATPTSTDAEKSIEELRGRLLDVLTELLRAGRNDDVIELVKKLIARNDELEARLVKMFLGRNHSERISDAQLSLFLDQLRTASKEQQAEANASLHQVAQDNAGRPEVEPPRQPPVRRKPSSALRRVDNPIDVPVEDRPCPVCGAERKCVCHETTEVIELIPAEVIVRRDIREVLACPRCDAEMERAPMGDKVVEGGAYGSCLVANLVVGKYRDSLPLHRLGEQLERLGLDMPSSSMSDQITWATDLLRPIWRCLREAVLASAVMHVDGTSLPVRDRDGPRGIVTGSLWGYVGDQEVAAYLYTSTGKKVGQREGEMGPEDFLALRKGPVVADAAGLFDKSFSNPARVEVGCNMHARRYFFRALEAGDARAAAALEAFQTLYDVEASTRDMDAQARLDERQRRSRPVYDELLSWSETYRLTEPPSSLLGKATQYLHNHRVALTRFLDDGRLPIDNGIVERLHRRPAVGRRNYLFAGSHAAAERAAIAYSVLGTCALLDVNPVEYLAEVLPRLARGLCIARDLPDLMPAAWKARQPAAPSSEP